MQVDSLFYFVNSGQKKKKEVQMSTPSQRSYSNTSQSKVGHILKLLSFFLYK